LKTKYGNPKRVKKTNQNLKNKAKNKSKLNGFNFPTSFDFSFLFRKRDLDLKLVKPAPKISSIFQGKFHENFGPND